MNLRAQLKENQVVVLLIPKKKFSSCLENTVSAADSISGKLCFVSLNKPYVTMAEKFEDMSLDVKDFLFIDCVTGRMANRTRYKVMFVSSPKALTELSLAIADVLNTDIQLIVFDSLSTLLAYEESGTVIKFVHAIVSKIRMTKKKCIFILLTEDKDSDLMKDVAMFVDKIANA